MFNINEFYTNAHNGEMIDKSDVLSYITSFQKIILWGAGNLGEAIGAMLLNNNISNFIYWDMNYKQKKLCNHVVVKEPFKEIENRNDTLVIACIVNGSLGEEWTKKELNNRGFLNCFSGMTLYEGLVCPLHKDNFDIVECTTRKACSLCNCKKYTSLINKKINQRDNFNFQLITFIISTRCTLNCKYCGQRLSEYDSKEKMDFPVENIMRDIDNFMDAVDFVGMISIIGGEPFVHPKLVEIVRHCLTKQNFGVVNITTNGIVKLTKEMLSELKNDRVKISFSIYDKFLNDKQKELLEKNIKLVMESGVNYSLSHPLWVKPGELADYCYDEGLMIQKKANCDSIIMCASVRNGVFYPCSIAENMESLHKFSAGNSIVDVTDKLQLRKNLKQCLEQKFFDSCRYCSNEKAEEIIAGEQC